MDTGNTVLVIEHNLDVVKCADWVIDLGPEGGRGGGRVLGEGTPEHIAKIAESHTGRFLAPMLHLDQPRVRKAPVKTSARATTAAGTATKARVAKASATRSQPATIKPKPIPKPKTKLQTKTKPQAQPQHKPKPKPNP